jgi:hypothetical protein
MVAEPTRQHGAMGDRVFDLKFLASPWTRIAPNVSLLTTSLISSFVMCLLTTSGTFTQRSPQP